MAAGQVVINGVRHTKQSRRLSDGYWWVCCECGWRGKLFGRPLLVVEEWRAHLEELDR